MKHLRGIEAFVKAAETGSIAAAARQLGCTAAAAGQAIARLEAAVGLRLLNRTTRALSLTDGGERYFQRVRDLTRQLESAHAELDELRDEPQGPLRLACTVAFGRHVIAPLLPAFIAAHPRVTVDLLLTDGDVDHVKQQVDVSVRFREQLEPGLVARRLAAVPMIFCASPAYLDRAGRPQQPEALKDHDCLAFRVPRDGLVLRWAFVRDGVRFEPQVRNVLTCNDIDALGEMAVAGAGITRLGSFVANALIADGRLEPLFIGQARRAGAAQAEALEFFACVQDRRSMPVKVRRLVQHLADQMRGHPLLQPPAWPRAGQPAATPGRKKR